MATNATTREVAALESDINERFENVTVQLAVLNNKIAEIQDTQTVADFPHEQAQIREKVLTAFQDEITNLGNRIQTLESHVSDLKTRMDAAEVLLGI